MSTLEPDARDKLFRDQAAVGTARPNIFGVTLSDRALSTAKEPVDRAINSFSRLYLHDDMLAKVRRASRVHSRDVRPLFWIKHSRRFLHIFRRR